MRLPGGDRAIVDIRKLRDYWLSPLHLRGRHKARVFKEAIGVGQADAEWLRDILRDGARTNEAIHLGQDAYGTRWCVDIIVTRGGRTATVRTIWINTGRRGSSSIRDMLGGVMVPDVAERTPALLDTVAVLVDRPEAGIGRGSVGTVVDVSDSQNLLVEFADNEGHAYAITPCPTAELLVLRFVPAVAA
jgi:Domain of unknown function (DUF4926)